MKIYAGFLQPFCRILFIFFVSFCFRYLIFMDSSTLFMQDFVGIPLFLLPMGFQSITFFMHPMYMILPYQSFSSIYFIKSSILLPLFVWFFYVHSCLFVGFYCPISRRLFMLLLFCFWQICLVVRLLQQMILLVWYCKFLFLDFL